MGKGKLTYVDQTIVLMLQYILARLAVDAVVHQLVKVFPESVLRFTSKLRVFADVRLKPTGLRKLNNRMDLAQDHTVLKVELESAVMTHVIALVEEIRNELRLLETRLHLVVVQHLALLFRHFVDLHYQTFGCKWKITVRVVEVVGVVEVALDKVSLVLIIRLIAPVDVSDFVLIEPMRKTDTQTIRVFVSEVWLFKH